MCYALKRLETGNVEKFLIKGFGKCRRKIFPVSGYIDRGVENVSAFCVLSRSQSGKMTDGIRRMYITSPISSTSVCVTMTAAVTPHADGNANASGSTTSELRVTALKINDLPA